MKYLFWALFSWICITNYIFAHQRDRDNLRELRQKYERLDRRQDEIKEKIWRLEKYNNRTSEMTADNYNKHNNW